MIGTFPRDETSSLAYCSENYETCSTQALELKSLHLAQAYIQDLLSF
jgi:hypothetical protein